MTKRLLLALLAYAALAVLAFKTLDDPRVRGVTLAVLAMFAVKTWVRRKDVMHPNDESEHDAGIEEREILPKADS